MDVSDSLKSLKELHDSGRLSSIEYEAAVIAMFRTGADRASHDDPNSASHIIYRVPVIDLPGL